MNLYVFFFSFVLCTFLYVYSFEGKYRDLLCFKENKQLESLKTQIPSTSSQQHQNQYIDSEYARMGVPNNYWKLTDININYEICDTYVIVYISLLKGFFKL